MLMTCNHSIFKLHSPTLKHISIWKLIITTYNTWVMQFYFHENGIDMLTTGKQNNDFFLCSVFHSTLLCRLITPENKHQQTDDLRDVSLKIGKQ